MTGQPRTLCCVCFRQWAPAGHRRCPDCDPSRAVPNNTATVRRATKTPDLSELFEGLTLADALERGHP